MNKPSNEDVRVSIVTATFNSEKTIIQTYHSLCSQTHDNWEWLVTDDCSNDNTVKVLEKLVEKDCRIKLFRNKINSGAAVSRNNSLFHVSGDYIAFIDSDDLWLKDKLKVQLNFMIKNNSDFTFTSYNIIDEFGKEKGKVVDKDNVSFVDYSDMLKKKATMGCSTVMVKAESFQNIRMPLLRSGQDYATWLIFLKKVKKAYLVNDVLTSYRILPGSVSRNKYKKAKRQWEIYRVQEGLSFFKSLYCFTFYAYRAVFRK